MRIHREGHLLLFITFLILVSIHILLRIVLKLDFILFSCLYFPVFILFILLLQFFRIPAIQTPVNPKHIIAPANGKVVVIEKTVETEFFKDERIQISIFMSPFDVHVNRNPVSGIVKYFKYHPGKFLVAWHPKSSTENERTTLVTETQAGQPILMRQIAGALAKRIKWYVKEGDSVIQGEEFGFIKFGSRVDVFLPNTTSVMVKLNQKTIGGETVIAELV
jgi:phosphatidylserine decarboxylase